MSNERETKEQQKYYKNNCPRMPTNFALPRGSGGPFESTSLDSLISKRQVQGMTRKGIRSLGGDVHKYIPPRTLCWQSRHAIYAVTNDPKPIASLHSLLMVAFLLILRLNIFILGSSINQKLKTLILRLADKRKRMLALP